MTTSNPQAYDYIEKILGTWAQEPNNLWAVAFRVGLAILIAAFIGSERARKRHAAGLRTFILVGMTSVLAALCDDYMVTAMQVSVPFLSAAILICISTIRGKTLLYTSRYQLRGLTTSVCLLTVAVMSLCLGLGMYTCALIGFLVILICMAILPMLESYMKGHSVQFELHLELKSRANLQDFIGAVREFGLHIDEIEINPAYANTGLGVYTVKVTIESEKLLKTQHEKIIEAVGALDSVGFVEEIF